MRNGTTVRELAAELNEAIKNGYGDKIVLISDDEEGNGFHGIWYSLMTDVDTIRETKEFTDFHDNNDPEDVVLLG